jgi:hypothetical protein
MVDLDGSFPALISWNNQQQFKVIDPYDGPELLEMFITLD